MKCWVCNAELIWGGDHDIEPFDEGDYSIVTNLSCPKCDAFVEVYHSKSTEKENEKTGIKVNRRNDYRGLGRITQST